MNYKKTYKSKSDVADIGRRRTAGNFRHNKDAVSDDDVSKDGDSDIDEFDRSMSMDQGYRKRKFQFNDSHPGKCFSQLAQLKESDLPNIYVPDGNLCRIESLNLDNKKVDDKTINL